MGDRMHQLKSYRILAMGFIHPINNIQGEVHMSMCC